MTESKEVFLMTLGEDLQVEIIEGELKNAGIPLLKKHRLGGAYLSLYMGRSMYGVDLYVWEDSYHIAREIIHDLGIKDIEGKDIYDIHEPTLSQGGKEKKGQMKIFQVGVFLIFLLWLLLWWRSA